MAESDEPPAAGGVAELVVADIVAGIVCFPVAWDEPVAG